jgi:DNA-3-methyladenine glycosylase
MGVSRSIDFGADSVAVARGLIGMLLLVDGVGGVIVEAEAYDQSEPAAHSHGGPTMRNASLFGPPGHAYVYRSYGLHWCLNFVCREAGHGCGVLIRALEPTHGIALMQERRGVDKLQLLCAGPGRVGKALGIARGHDGLALDRPPFRLLTSGADQGEPPVSGRRIGISKAADLPWRFGLAGSRYLSRPF